MARFHKTAVLQFVHNVKPAYDIPVSEAKPNRCVWKMEHKPTSLRLCTACEGHGHVSEQTDSGIC